MGTTNLDALELSGALTVTGAVSTGALTPASVAATGAVTVGTTLGVTGATTLTGKVNGQNPITTTDVAIAGADFYAMNGIPQTLVADPGDGYALQFCGALIMIDYATAAFDFGAGEDLVIRYTDGSGDIVSASLDSTLLNVSADAYYFLEPIATAVGGPTSHTLTASEALVGHILVGDGTAGGSTVKMRIFTRTITLSELAAIS